MKFLAWLLALALSVPSMAQPQTQSPDPGSPTYHQEVASSIQDLTSGRRPRDPRMSGASTGRLILEGVVENVRIYRLWKEEKAREAKEAKKREKKTEKGKGKEKVDGGQQERRHRSRERENGKRRRRHRHHSGCGVDGENCRHKRRHRHRQRSVGDGEGDRSHRDAEDGHEARSQRSRSASRDILPSLSTQNLLHNVVHAAEHLFGPDGTPFGSLPTREKRVGFVAHAKTMYRHIKAEQEAGHRSKGFAEKHVDAFLEKRKDGARPGKSRDKRREDREPIIFTQMGRERHHPGQREQSRREREKGESSRDAGRPPKIRIQSPTPPELSRSVRSRTPSAREPSLREHSPVPERSESTASSRTPSPSPSPTPPFMPTTRPNASSPFIPAAPPMPGKAPRYAKIPPAVPSVADVPMPSMPVAPPMPLAPAPRLPVIDPDRGALLAGILGGTRLRKVPASEKKDKSVVEGGKVMGGVNAQGKPIYESTPHSRDVEALEHAQDVEEEERQEEVSRGKSPTQLGKLCSIVDRRARHSHGDTTYCTTPTSTHA